MSDIANMLRFHYQGLQRVSRVIDGNANYDELMEHRLGESHWAVFEGNSNTEKKRSEAIALFDKSFWGRKPKAIIPEFEGFVCEGSTRNNLREFEFFERICASANIKILDANYAECESISVSKITGEQQDARESISTEVRDFYDSRTEITASLVRQQILYSRSFFNFLLAFSRPGAVKPAALVQANDHSPVRVALSMVIKGLGIPRVYLQHAEVTENFPGLDFDFSVLRNERSRKIYAAISPVGGETFVIAREEQEFARDRLFSTRGQGVTVAIYPTARVLVGQTIRVIEELRKNPSVGKIIVKQHPAAAKMLDGSLGGLEVTFSKDIPEEDHIAIVGNSSIAIELLHQGLPVYQNFDFDPVSDDYYGFVTRGLTYSVTLSELSGMFWRAYPPNENWIEAFAQLDPTATPEQADEKRRFVDTMTEIAKKANSRPVVHRTAIKGRFKAQAKAKAKRAILGTINASPRLSEFMANRVLAITDQAARFLLINTHNAARFFHLYTDIEVRAPIWRGNGPAGLAVSLPGRDLLQLIEYTLEAVERPAVWLRMNEKTQAFTPLAVISALEQMFQNRNPVLSVVLRDYEAGEPSSAVGVWILLKKSEWGNMTVEGGDLDEIATFIYAYNDDARVRAILEKMLFSSIIRRGSCEQLDRFWSGSKTGKDRLPINRKIDVLRKLRSSPERKGEYEELLRFFKSEATPFEALKLTNADILDGAPVSGWDHRRAEQEFERTAPNQIAREFAARVRPVYDQLRPRMGLIDARTDESLSREIMELASAALKNRTPFSLVRLSDGEGYLFPGGDFFTEADVANRERHWWGTELPVDLRTQIVKEARQAIATADLVGIPSVYRFIRDTSDTSPSLFRTLQGRGLTEVLNGVPTAVSAKALITEDKVNVALFKDVSAIEPLVALAGKTIIVTSTKPENLPAELTRGRRIDIVAIPTHHKTTLNAKYHNGSEALPFVYRSVMEKLDEGVEPGDLVLVAGGIVGKIFIGHVREKGAAVLDIGHTLDDWVHEQLPSLR
ncbi:MAG: hypothetical protein RIB57_06180 [Pelagibacterium sp.]|uniref:GT-D fold domain-containing protein n=1 Tax=Pelagibacterium sp. TaxID=1967288 RepID=UPI0032EE0E0C